MEESLPSAPPTPPPTSSSKQSSPLFEAFRNPYVGISVAFILLILMLYLAYLVGPMLKKTGPSVPQQPKEEKAQELNKNLPVKISSVESGQIESIAREKIVIKKQDGRTIALNLKIPTEVKLGKLPATGSSNKTKNIKGETVQGSLSDLKTGDSVTVYYYQYDPFFKDEALVNKVAKQVIFFLKQ